MFCLSIAFVGILTFLLNFTAIFSVLRTRPHGKSCSMVEVKAASTPSRVAELHPPCRIALFLVLRLRPPSGISVLFILPIRLCKVLLRHMIYHVLHLILPRQFVMHVNMQKVINYHILHPIAFPLISRASREACVFALGAEHLQLWPSDGAVMMV
jgi:hypothetical protein